MLKIFAFISDKNMLLKDFLFFNYVSVRVWQCEGRSLQSSKHMEFSEVVAIHCELLDVCMLGTKLGSSVKALHLHAESSLWPQRCLAEIVFTISLLIALLQCSCP